MNLFNFPVSPDEEEAVAPPQASSLVDTRTTPQAVASLLTPPKSPLEQARENHGGAGFMLKAILGGMTGTGSMLLPEFSRSNKAQYESDLELYNTYREMSLVDPQVEDLATALEEQGRHFEAKIVRAGGADKLNLNNRVLSQGQGMFGSDGSLIAEVAPKDESTSIQRNARDIAGSLGINTNAEPGSPDALAYADIMTALAEPSGTTTLTDGTVKTYNMLDTVTAKWNKGGYGNSSAQASGGQPSASGSGGSGGYLVGPDEAAQATLNQAITEQTAQEAAAAEVALKDYDNIMTSVNNLGEWRETTDAQGNKVRKFVPVSGFETILGNIGGTWGAKGISTLFSQDAANAEAELNTLLSKLTVNERQRLVGQGQITEGEQKMLADAVSILTSTTISEERAGEALETIVTIMGDSKVRAENILGTADPQNRMESRHMSGEGVSFGGKVYHKESDFLKDAQAKGADMEKAQAKWRELTGG
jgi:hypothetical protein